MRLPSARREALGECIDREGGKRAARRRALPQTGQFRVSRTCCSIRTAIIITRPPPSKSGRDEEAERQHEDQDRAREDAVSA